MIYQPRCRCLLYKFLLRRCIFRTEAGRGREEVSAAHKTWSSNAETRFQNVSVLDYMESIMKLELIFDAALIGRILRSKIHLCWFCWWWPQSNNEVQGCGRELVLIKIYDRKILSLMKLLLNNSGLKKPVGWKTWFKEEVISVSEDFLLRACIWKNLSRSFEAASSISAFMVEISQEKPQSFAFSKYLAKYFPNAMLFITFWWNLIKLYQIDQRRL